MNIQAQYYSQRSPLYRAHGTASLRALGETLLVAEYGEGDEPGALQGCALIDLCNLPRVGLRGRDSAEYLQARGFRLPDAPNQALTQADGGQVVRLSQTEYLLLGSLADGGERVRQEELTWRQDERANYLLPRQDSHAWLLLAGPSSVTAMAKLCGVDLRPEVFAPGSVAQTSAARVNVIIANLPLASAPALHILCDRAAVEYLWEALLDAMTEFDGRPVGIQALGESPYGG